MYQTTSHREFIEPHWKILSMRRLTVKHLMERVIISCCSFMINDKLNDKVVFNNKQNSYLKMYKMTPLLSDKCYSCVITLLLCTQIPGSLKDYWLIYKCCFCFQTPQLNNKHEQIWTMTEPLQNVFGFCLSCLSPLVCLLPKTAKLYGYPIFWQ